jgi:hypothetical protein
VVVFYLVGLLVAALLAGVTNYFADPSPIPSFFDLPAPGTGASSGIAAVALAIATVALGRVLEPIRAYARMAEWLRRGVDQLLGRPVRKDDAFLVAFSSSVGEEAFFRGFLQPFFGWLVATKLLGRPELGATIGIGVTTLIFGIVHFPVVRELIPWTLFALLIGVMFGILYSWSGSLLPPIAAHFLINFLNLRRLAELPDPGPVPSDRAAR